MELRITTKKGRTSSFTQEQLCEIASHLKVCLPDKMRLVYYGQKPPLDVTLTWQPTNGIGDPVGMVKKFIDGSWK